MRKSRLTRFAGSQWGRAGLLVVAGGIGGVFVAVEVPDWFSLTGDNTEYWITEDLDLYLSLGVIGFGVAWSAVVLAVQEIRGRQRRDSNRR